MESSNKFLETYTENVVTSTKNQVTAIQKFTSDKSVTIAETITFVETAQETTETIYVETGKNESPC